MIERRKKRERERKKRSNRRRKRKEEGEYLNPRLFRVFMTQSLKLSDSSLLFRHQFFVGVCINVCAQVPEAKALTPT